MSHHILASIARNYQQVDRTLVSCLVEPSNTTSTFHEDTTSFQNKLTWTTVSLWWWHSITNIKIIHPSLLIYSLNNSPNFIPMELLNSTLPVQPLFPHICSKKVRKTFDLQHTVENYINIKFKTVSYQTDPYHPNLSSR